jgi:hypothetical protein
VPENFRRHTSGTGQIFAVRRARALPLLVQREEQLEELARRAVWSGVREARWRRSECTAFAGVSRSAAEQPSRLRPADTRWRSRRAGASWSEVAML